MVVAAGSAHAAHAQPVEPEGGASADAAPAPTTSQPSPLAIDQLTLSDDLIAAVGLRPIGDRRVEARVSTGNDATHQAALRATDTILGAGLELTGSALRSDVLGDQSEAAARIAHTSDHHVAGLHATYTADHVGFGRQSFLTDMRTATYGAAWTESRAPGRVTLELYGEQQTLRDTRQVGTLELDGSLLGAHVGFTSRSVQAFGLDHEFSGDIDVMQANGVASETDGDPDEMHMTMLPRTRHGRHRFLSAYIHDTVRVIESLDVHGGFVFEHWRWLTNIASIYGPDLGESMDQDAAVISSLMIGPKVGALYRVTPNVAVTANAYRTLRTPTWQQLMRPVQNGEVVTVADDQLHPETVTGAQLGPTVVTPKLEARVVGFWNEVAAPIADIDVGPAARETTNLGHAREIGVDASASWRIAKSVLAGAGYTYTNARITDAASHPALAGNVRAQTPRHRATAALTYDRPTILTVTGTVRFADQRFANAGNTIALAPVAVVDAMAARKLTHGLAGFVSVENIFDRRFVWNQAGVDTIGAPRLIQVGVRLDSARW